MLAALALLLHQPLVATPTAPSEDAAGDWRQRARHALAGRPSEGAGVPRATVALAHATDTPDTLREGSVHRCPDAVRRAAWWSAVDGRVGRARARPHGDADEGAERCAAYLLVYGAPPAPERDAGAPDDSVVRIPLAVTPNDALTAALARAAATDDPASGWQTADRALQPRPDPRRTTPDAAAPNDAGGASRLDRRVARAAEGSPGVARSAADRRVAGVTPLLWTGTPGGLTPAVRVQGGYGRYADAVDAGVAVAVRRPDGSPGLTRLQGWLAVENPRLPGAARPLVGLAAGAWALDGVARLAVTREWDASRYFDARAPRLTYSLGATALVPYDARWPDPARWSLGRSYELRAGAERRGAADATLLRGELAGGYATRGADADGGAGRRGGYGRATADARRLFTRGGGRQVTVVRGYAAVTVDAPVERLAYASSLDPVQSFENHFLRPRGGVLSGPDARYVSVGNGGLRAYDFRLAGRSLAAANVEHAVRVGRLGAARGIDLYADAFADAGVLDAPRLLGGTAWLGDAGVGVAARGPVFDRDVRVRVDFPLYVVRPGLVASADRNDDDRRVGARLTFSFTDLW